MPSPSRLALPEPDVEYRLAYRLLSARSSLDREVLLALVARPRRYAELKPLLRGRRDHNLTKSLHRLRWGGLVDQRGDFRHDPPVTTYELSNLGTLVVFRMMQMLPAHESAEALLRGRAAGERASA